MPYWPTQYSIDYFGGGLHSQSLDCYWQTNNKEKLNINHKIHTNTVWIKENKQLNTEQKQNYPDSVASYDTQPGNEVGLFYNGPLKGSYMGTQFNVDFNYGQHQLNKNGK